MFFKLVSQNRRVVVRKRPTQGIDFRVEISFFWFVFDQRDGVHSFMDSWVFIVCKWIRGRHQSEFLGK